jgi:hypothetical protein
MGKKHKVVKDKKDNSSICINKDCKIRKAGCKGSKNCPGYKSS